MLKREGMISLLVGVIGVVTRDAVEGEVGLGSYRQKANIGKKEQQSIDDDAMRNHT